MLYLSLLASLSIFLNHISSQGPFNQINLDKSFLDYALYSGNFFLSTLSRARGLLWCPHDGRSQPGFWYPLWGGILALIPLWRPDAWMVRWSEDRSVHIGLPGHIVGAFLIISDCFRRHEASIIYLISDLSLTIRSGSTFIEHVNLMYYRHVYIYIFSYHFHRACHLPELLNLVPRSDHSSCSFDIYNFMFGSGIMSNQCLVSGFLYILDQ